MSEGDGLAAWRDNPFFVLGVDPEASRLEVERAGQKLIGLLTLGAASAARAQTPLGPLVRDADAVRQALATLRDPTERVTLEVLADIAQPPPRPGADPAAAWQGAERLLGWNGTWAR